MYNGGKVWWRCGGDGETVGDDGGAETAVAMVVAMAAARWWESLFPALEL